MYVSRAQLSNSPDSAADPSTHAGSDISNGPLHSQSDTHARISPPYPRQAAAFKTHRPTCSGAV